MIDTVHFKTWLKENTSYSDAVISDTISRLKRADAILEITEEEVYIFYLERMPEFKKISTSVRSQIKKSVRLYLNFRNVSMRQPIKMYNNK